MQDPVVEILGWPNSLFSFFHKVKDTFFIFTINFIDLDILSMSAMSHYWLPLHRGGLPNISQCMRQPHSKELFGQNVNCTKKLYKLLLTCSINHSTFSIHINCTNLFLHFSCVFTFLEIRKHNTLKILYISFQLQY